MTRMDTTRLGKNFAYMTRTLQHIPEDQYLFAAKEVLEHHFDNHVYCGDWCRRKNKTEEERQQGKKYYHDKVKDHDLSYCVLEKITFDCLKEIAAVPWFTAS